MDVVILFGYLWLILKWVRIKNKIYLPTKSYQACLKYREKIKIDKEPYYLKFLDYPTMVKQKHLLFRIRSLLYLPRVKIFCEYRKLKLKGDSDPPMKKVPICLFKSQLNPIIHFQNLSEKRKKLLGIIFSFY